MIKISLPPLATTPQTSLNALDNIDEPIIKEYNQKALAIRILTREIPKLTSKSMGQNLSNADRYSGPVSKSYPEVEGAL